MSATHSAPVPPRKPALRSILLIVFSCCFGLAVFIAGLVNCFYGNDPWFGVFICCLSLAFFPPVTRLVTNITGFRMPPALKFLLGIFIIWVLLGVGELLPKLDLFYYDFFAFRPKG